MRGGGSFLGQGGAAGCLPGGWQVDGPARSVIPIPILILIVGVGVGVGVGRRKPCPAAFGDAEYVP